MLLKWLRKVCSPPCRVQQGKHSWQQRWAKGFWIYITFASYKNISKLHWVQSVTETNTCHHFEIHYISMSCRYPLTMWCYFSSKWWKLSPGYRFLLYPLLSYCFLLTICIKPPVQTHDFPLFDISSFLKSHLSQSRDLDCPWKPNPAPRDWILCCSKKLATTTWTNIGVR